MSDVRFHGTEIDDGVGITRAPVDGWSPPGSSVPPWVPTRHSAGPYQPGPRNRRTGRRRFVVLVVAMVIVAGVAGGGAGWLVARSTVSETTSEPAVATVEERSAEVADLVDAADDSILAIVVTVQYRQGPFVSEGEGAGTGIVLTSDGLVVTNAHVVEDATTITVTLPGETEPRTAELVGIASAVDVAVIRILDVTGLMPATFADSDGLRVGDDVVAIGNALDLGDTMSVTRGIVSALDRTIDTDDATYTGLIQTDAAISSGNSGGALLDMDGAVIGMNAAAAASSSGVTAENIGFAIPSNQVLEAIADIGVPIG